VKTVPKPLARTLMAFVVATGLAFGGQLIVGAPTDPVAGAASSGGVLTVGEPLQGTNTIEFDPVQFTGPVASFPYAWPIYAGLLRETTSGNYVPDLASSVTVPDPSTIDITVRPGVVYSNGAALNAAAVKAGFERNLTNPLPGAWNPVMYDLSTVEVTGPRSVVLHFSQPVASTFYPLLADEESFMALPTGASTGSQNTNVVGAGPFMLKSFTPDQIVLVKNPRYWNAKSIGLSGITFVDVPLGPQQVNALEAGSADVVVGLPVTDVPALRGNPNLQLQSSFPDANYYFSPICKASGPLASVKVRQALNFATDRVAINRALFEGRGEPAWSIFPSSSAYYDKSLTNIYAYNVKKAKQLMAEAGYPHGFSTTLMALPSASDEQVATVLQSEWSKIGVSVQLVSTSNFVTDLYRQHKAQIGLVPAGLPGIDKLTTDFIPPANGDICQYSSPTLNSLASQLEAAAPTSPKVKALWTQVQNFVIRNALAIFIVYSPLVTGAQKFVHHLQSIPYVGGVLNYWTVTVSR